MDIIDNVMFARMHSPLLNGPIGSDFLAALPPVAPINIAGAGAPPNYSYDMADKMDFCAFADSMVLETSIVRHWYDVAAQVNYDFVNPPGNAQVRAFGTNLQNNDVRYSSFETMRNYHLIYAYLLENTRMLQIFERLIERYMTDEEFGIAANFQAFNWLHNTERVFFKSDTSSTLSRSLIRPNADATRRNAYWRMFGMDLSFGDINSTNGSLPYTKARSSNQQFIVLFEKYLTEIWHGYSNARNFSGVNTTDINIIVDLAMQLQELLTARRGDAGGSFYSNLNLSREEFSAVLITSWFTCVLSDDTPVVQFLNCQSSTIGERLLKIGTKVGIPAHSKCQALFELAGPTANILSLIEVGGVLNNEANMQNILTSLNPPVVPSVFGNYMTDLLTIVNNWERATGHKIKNPDVKLSGSVKLAPSAPIGQKVSLN